MIYEIFTMKMKMPIPSINKQNSLSMQITHESTHLMEQSPRSSLALPINIWRGTCCTRQYSVSPE